MKSAETVKTKNTFQIDRRVQFVFANTDKRPEAILADSSGSLPATIALLQVGMWRTPWHGDIMITPNDLVEYVEHYDQGICRAGNGTLGLPINFNHEQGGLAVGWIKGVYVEGDTLYANVEWTEAGKQALTSGEWKCISAEFYPAGRGGWPNPLDENEFIENVLEGAALTNIPLFSGLEPVMASASMGKKASPSIFVMADNSKKEEELPMAITLEEVRAKELSALSEEEKTFVAEHKEELTAEEQVSFGLAEAPVVKKEDEEASADPIVAVDPEPAAVAASIKAGTHVVIEASALKKLQDSTEQYQTEKAEQIVKTHASRGAIKADQVEGWTNRLVAASGAARTDLEEALSALPDHPVLASEKGSDKSGDAKTAVEQINEKAEAIMASAKEAGTPMNLGTAMSQVLRENPELGTEYQNETQRKES